MKQVLIAALAALVTGCSPPPPLAPLAPRPQAGELAGVRIALEASSPGSPVDVPLRDTFAKAFADAGLEVVAPEDGPTLFVLVSQPLGEWSGAYFCSVLTYGAADRKAPISERSVDHKCATPNTADHAVAMWLSDPKVKLAVAKLH